MNLLNRVSGKLFKANLKANVDFHANGFFVKKEVSYLAFLTNGLIAVYNRTEGTNAYDDDALMVLDEISKGMNVTQMEVVSDENNAYRIKMKSSGASFICVPSIFIQNLESSFLTEVALCNQTNGEVIIYQLYSELK